MIRSPQLDAYIAEAAPFAQPILRHLRALVHRGCPGVTESLKWGHPSFGHADAILCSMAAFKAHCAFGFWHVGMETVLAADGYNLATAMGGFGRITRREDLPPDAVLLRYIQAAAALNASGAPGRPRPKARAKPEAKVPPDLAAALKKNKAAAIAFQNFSPSHRREYIEWITEAKREETRQKRLDQTLAWLAEGKSRNWKYAAR